MKSKLLTLVASLALALTTGCKTVKISPALVRTGVATGVSYALVKYPQVVPELRIAREVICSTANGTNLSPANVVAEVNKISALSPETVLIINGSLVLYTGIWESYGVEAVNNAPVLKTYLQATCNGITDALPEARARFVPPLQLPAWPLVRFK